LGPVAIFGIAFAMLHQAAEPRRFHCAACDHHFTRRTVIAWIFQFVLYLFIVAIGLFTIAFIAAFVIGRVR
jgi:hypothetical protein